MNVLFNATERFVEITVDASRASHASVITERIIQSFQASTN